MTRVGFAAACNAAADAVSSIAIDPREGKEHTMRKSTTVDDYIERVEHWPDEVGRLREVVASTGLEETIKWGAPCYTHGGKNVVGLGSFRQYFGLWFYQGVQLDDAANVLINAQEGKTVALRQWRMTSMRDIRPTLIRRYVAAAVRVVDEGREIKPARGAPVSIPVELEAALAGNDTAAKRFSALRTGQRREYAEYIATAKRQDTKTRRIDRILPMIIAGAGLNDRYR